MAFPGADLEKTKYLTEMSGGKRFLSMASRAVRLFSGGEKGHEDRKGHGSFEKVGVVDLPLEGMTKNYYVQYMPPLGSLHAPPHTTTRSAVGVVSQPMNGAYYATCRSRCHKRRAILGMFTNSQLQRQLECVHLGWQKSNKKKERDDIGRQCME